MVEGKMTLMQWDVRGFTESIRMLMEYLHIDYKEIKLELDDLKPIETSEELWTSVKESLGLDFPSLPNLCDLEHKVSLSCTIAICKYLAQKYRPKMVGSAMNEYAEIDSVLLICHDMRNAVIEAHEKGWEKSKEDALTLVKEKLGYFNKFMKSRIWISGKQPSVADFIFSEMIELLLHIDSTMIDAYPNCRKWLRKFCAIPEIVKYKSSQSGFDIAKYLILPIQYEH